MPLWRRDGYRAVPHISVPIVAFPGNPERRPPRHIYSGLFFECSHLSRRIRLYVPHGQLTVEINPEVQQTAADVLLNCGICTGRGSACQALT